MIQDHIKRPLADELLFGKLAKGGKVLVTIADDKLAFHIAPGRRHAACCRRPTTARDEDTGEDQILEPVG